jgi:hypothetical protein
VGERTKKTRFGFGKVAAACVVLLLLGVMASSAVADDDPFSALSALTSSTTTSTSSDGTGASTDATTTDSTTSTDATTQETTTADTTTADTTTTEATTSEATTGSAATASPTITSDKSDYAPGSTVTLTGAGWGVGESVHLFVNDTIGQTWQYNADVTADLSGGFTTQFQLPATFISNYDVTATGSVGEIATASFTDANVNVQTIGVAAATVAWIRRNTTNCTGPVAASGSVNATSGGNGAAIPGGASATQSLLLTAGAVTGATFSDWSKGDFTTGDPSTANPVCLKGAGNTQNIAVTYSTVAATSLSVAPASGTFGDTVNLSATLSSSGNPVSGKSVSFTLNGTSEGSATTNGSGIASLSNVSLSGINVGTYNPGANSGVAASFAGDSDFSGSAGSATLIVNKADQSISFAALGNKVFGNASFAVSATGGGSGNPVTFSIGASDNCTSGGTNGSTITITGAGSCTVTANQAGTGNYNAAPPVSRSFSIAKKNLTVTADDQLITYGNPDPAFSFKYSGGFVGTDAASDIDTPPVCGVAGDHSNAGSYDIVCSGGIDNNYSFSYVKGTLTISAKPLTGSFAANDKVYDATATATVDTKSLPGIIGADDVTLVVSSPHFDNTNVGTGKDVTGALSLSGDDAGNYSLTSASFVTQAAISAKPLTGSFTANDKVYDATATATVDTKSLPGVIGLDDVSLVVTSPHFDNKNVGTGKDVTGALSLSGDDAGNYSLTSGSFLTAAAITPLGITGSFISAAKVYDGNTDAAATDRELSGLLGSDVVTLIGGTASFADKNVGTNKLVTLTGATLGGADAGNYSLSSVGTQHVDITPKLLTGSFTANNKVYDGTTVATVNTKSLPGIIGADAVALEVANPQFDNKNVGTAKNVTGALSLSGAGAGNYSLTSASFVTTANIMRAPLTVTADDQTKILHGANPTFTVSYSGFVPGEDKTSLGGTLAFTTNVPSPEQVGTWTITPSGLTSDNYAVTFNPGTLKIVFAPFGGFLQPINDTAHQIGLLESKFKAGSTIPAKFVLKDALGAIVQQATSPVFSMSKLDASCGATTADTTETVAPDAGSVYTWDGSQYHFNWSTKGLKAGEYRIYAALADGSKPYVNICLN